MWLVTEVGWQRVALMVARKREALNFASYPDLESARARAHAPTPRFCSAWLRLLRIAWLRSGHANVD